jgi:hypothetical protein
MELKHTANLTGASIRDSLTEADLPAAFRAANP